MRTGFPFHPRGACAPGTPETDGTLRGCIQGCKIDGSFVRDILKDPGAASLVYAIVQLAHGMSLATVAEYVETEEIRALVASLAADYGQGFAIGKPRPLVDVLAELPQLVAT